jgi:hypothetical protein
MRLNRGQRANLLAHATDYARANTPAEAQESGDALIKFVNDLVAAPRGFAADRGWHKARQERDMYARSACDQLIIGNVDRASAYAAQSAKWQTRMEEIEMRYQDQQQRGKQA